MSKVTGLSGGFQTVSSQSVEPAQPDLQTKNQPSPENSEPPSSGVLRIGSRDAGRRLVEHRVEGQTRQADLNAQLPASNSITRSPIQFEQPPQTETATVEQTPPPVSPEAAGFSGAHRAVPNQQLQEYFSNRAPHHDLIAAGRYGQAARSYRRLAEENSRAGETNLATTNLNIASQLEFTGRMQQAGVRNLSFPPTDRNVDDYFSSLRREPASRVARDYEQYTSAFFVHHGRTTPLQYDAETHRINGSNFETHIPEDWNDITSSREIRNGQRMIDCEGYAYLGQRLLSRAGFREGRFTAVGSPSRTDGNESNIGHIMWSGTRRSVAGDPEGSRGFAIAISNNDATLIPANSSRTPDQTREAALEHVYRALPRVRYRGESAQAWRAEYNATVDQQRSEETQ